MDAKAFGYDYIELWGGRPHAFAPDLLAGEMSAVMDLQERYAMPVEVYTPAPRIPSSHSGTAALPPKRCARRGYIGVCCILRNMPGI